MGNLFGDMPAEVAQREVFEELVRSPNVLIERIVSAGQITPADQWYDQPRDEWVALLQGEAVLAYADGSRVHLQAGDYLLIPAHQKHRVEFTSKEPPCIWLAIHADLSPH